MPAPSPAAAASADHQLRVFSDACAAGASEREAQIAVVDWLVEQSIRPAWAASLIRL